MTTRLKFSRNVAGRTDRIQLLAVSLTLALAVSGCEDKQPTAHAARNRKATTLPVKEPDARTVTELLNKQNEPQADERKSNVPAVRPPIGGMSSAKADRGLRTGHSSTEAAPTPPHAGASDIKYTPPPAWKEVPPATQMRKAQFVLPKTEGDPEDGQLVVFYFGQGLGGAVESNIERWKGMFTTPDGKPVADDAMKRESTLVNSMQTTLVDVTGRYTDQMGRPNQPGPTSQDFRMLAAIVETPEGPWFFKAVGPAATMASHASAFQEFVRGVHR